MLDMGSKRENIEIGYTLDNYRPLIFARQTLKAAITSPSLLSFWLYILRPAKAAEFSP